MFYFSYLSKHVKTCQTLTCFDTKSLTLYYISINLQKQKTKQYD